MIVLERSEDELLVSLVRSTLAVESTERVRRLVGGELDWEYLLAMADRHNVTPIVDHRLNSICPEAVPQGLLSRLRDSNRENTRQSLFLAGELLRLIGLLEAHGIC